MKCLNCTKENIDFKEINNSCFCLLPNSNTEDRNFFSQTSIFLSKNVEKEIKEVISTMEKLIKSKEFKKKVFGEKYEDLKSENIDGGILSSYDFHIVDNVPKLIEINTNAGGIFLNYQMLKKEEKCCANVELQSIKDFEEQIVNMFQKEFSNKNPNQKLQTVAIMDENIKEQFLYPELLICKEILEKNNIKTFILEPKDLIIKDNSFYFEDLKIELIYNRLTDFYFVEQNNQKFLEKTNTTISPNPHDYSLFADKANFVLFQDNDLLNTILTREEVEMVKKTIPKTVIVNSENENELWENKKQYFFKPLNGHGGKGTYNGRGLTKKVWEAITSSKYIAQEIVPPSIRLVNLNGEQDFYKFDIRAYTYDGEVLLLAGRLYSGQTTNFRTKGGGFAPIFLTEG